MVLLIDAGNSRLKWAWLRDGRPEALGFYLDHDRVHVGDLASLTDDVFTAWATDRANARVHRCAGFYDGTRTGLEGP